MARKLPRSFHCPTEFTLAILGGKWKTVILCFLKERPCRYAELRKLLPKLSDKMLTERLHELMASGLVVRRRRAGEQGQEYLMTARGRQLTSVLRDIDGWGAANARAFGVRVGAPMTELENEFKAEHG
jgi:DNA-binding HxlR family transcriptional regulator